jgi:hypothetical protein
MPRQSLSAMKEFFGTLFVDGLGLILAFVGVINPLSTARGIISNDLATMDCNWSIDILVPTLIV